MSDATRLLESMPFAAGLGIELSELGPEEVRGRMTWAPERCTMAGMLHGGALMAMADTVGAVCAFLNLPPETTTATIESKTNFLRAVREGHVDAVARPLHVGRTLMVVQTELHDDRGRRVAHVVQTQQVLQLSKGGSSSPPPTAPER
jgi:1,4-dihydroxy-2-naphthoyl-CoA hydrolase